MNEDKDLIDTHSVYVFNTVLMKSANCREYISLHMHILLLKRLKTLFYKKKSMSKEWNVVELIRL